MIVEVEQPVSGRVKLSGSVYKMSKTPGGIHLPAVRMGEHNEYVYKQILGFSDEEYAELEKEGHIGMDLVPDLQIGVYKAE